MCRKKIRTLHCFDVTSILTNDIIIFCWWAMVRMMMVTEKLSKIYENIFYNIFYEGVATVTHNGELSCILSDLSAKIGHGHIGLTKDIQHYFFMGW